MTAQKDIQSLIAAIDDLLHKASDPLARFKPRDLAQQRRVLEQVRSYLISQQSKVGAVEKLPMTQGDAAQQIYLAVVKEMETLRADIMQPLQTDVEALRKQRDSLLKEIRQMEVQRQQHQSLAQQQAKQQQIISEFLQGLTGRLQESLTQQVSQTVANIESQLLIEEEARGVERGESRLRGSRRSLHPAQRLEQMQQLQAHSDEMLMSLDATIRVVGEALQRNVQAYQASLSQGLERMHGLGQQGEVMFAALINHLAQQLGREASALSTLLQSQRVQLTELASQPEVEVSQEKAESLLPPTVPSRLPNASQDSQTPPVAESDLPLPFPGMELSAQPLDLVTPAIAELESLIASQPVEESSNALEDINPDNWEVIELDLNSLDIESLDESEIETFLQLDLELMNSLPTVEDLKADAAMSPEASISARQQVNLGLVPVSEELQEPLNVEKTFQPVTNPQNFSTVPSDSTVEDLDELYESLFGTEDLTDLEAFDEELFTDLELVDLPVDASTTETGISPGQTSDASHDSDVEDALFAELPESSTSLNAVPNFNGSIESWEDILFTEAIAPVETAAEPEAIETITALTDLFPEMYTEAALSSALIDGMLAEIGQSEIILNSTFEQQSSDLSLDLNHEEDSYTPASPEEDLLVKGELEPESNVDLWLAQDTIQQLSQDLSSFEGSPKQEVRVKPNPPLETTTDLQIMSEPEDFDPDLFLSEPWYLELENVLASNEVSGIVSDTHVATPPTQEQSEINSLPPEELNPDSAAQDNKRDSESETNF